MRDQIVGAPTWIRDVVVHIGAGTIRRAAVANGAEMTGEGGEEQIMVGSQSLSENSGVLMQFFH